jgi:hypothetical protein
VFEELIAIGISFGKRFKAVCGKDEIKELLWAFAHFFEIVYRRPV